MGWNKHFVGAALATLLLVSLLSLAIYPPARAWAQDAVADVLQSLHITHDPSHAEQVWENFAQNPHLPTDEELATKLDLEEAQAAVDFPLHLPTIIPDGYYFFAAHVHQDIVYQSDKPQVTIVYQKLGFERSLQLSQVRVAEPTEFPIGEGTAREITINGRPAIVVEDVMNSVTISLSESGDEILDYAKGHNTGLLWENGGTSYQLWANDLTIDEMVQIAESVE